MADTTPTTPPDVLPKQSTTVPSEMVTTCVTDLVVGVPADVLDAVGAGTTVGIPAPAAGTRLTADNKPEVLFIGAEYCPYCAFERWALVNALSRFGTWSDLSLIVSSTTDVYPGTATFTFHGAHYSSNVLAFIGKELQGREQTDGKYPPLDSLDATENSEYSQLNPNGAMPFIDIAGQFTVTGATGDTATLSGKSAGEIALALQDPASPIAQAVLGAANSLTRRLCVVTGNLPADVCTAPAVKAAT